jgi:hypothetical protein
MGLHPERVRYYLEKRGPEFETKMKDILLVYQEVALRNESRADGATARIVTLSVDEKPGLQAPANTAPDLPPLRVNIPRSGAITNTGDWAPVPSWRRWICAMAM